MRSRESGKGLKMLLLLGGAALLGLRMVLSQDGQAGVQNGAGPNSAVVEVGDPQLTTLEVDELPLTSEGVVDDDGYTVDHEVGGPVLVDEDVVAIPDDRPAEFLGEMLDG